MQQIADWLQKLGLGQYAQRFANRLAGVVARRFAFRSLVGSLRKRKGLSNCALYRHPNPKPTAIRVVANATRIARTSSR